MRHLDFGDTATGRPVNENDGFRLKRGAQPVTGMVVGVFPESPQHVTVQTPDGQVCIRRGA